MCGTDTNHCSSPAHPPTVSSIIDTIYDGSQMQVLSKAVVNKLCINNILLRPLYSSCWTEVDVLMMQRYKSMQPKSLEEEEADSAKKVQRRQARANKQKLLQTPSPPQERPFYLSKIYVCDTQPRLDLVRFNSSLDSETFVIFCLQC